MHNNNEVSPKNATDLETLLDNLKKDYEKDNSKYKGRGISRKIIEELTSYCATTRERIREISKDSDIYRRVLIYLKKGGLIYEASNGILISIPCAIYLYLIHPKNWIKILFENAPEQYLQELQQEDIEKLTAIVQEAANSEEHPLKMFVITSDVFGKLASEAKSIVLALLRDEFEIFLYNIAMYISLLLDIINVLFISIISNQNYDDIVKEFEELYKSYQKSGTTEKSEDADADNATKTPYPPLFNRLALRTLEQLLTLLKRETKWLDYIKQSSNKIDINIFNKLIDWSIDNYKQAKGLQEDIDKHEKELLKSYIGTFILYYITASQQFHFSPKE